MAEVTAKTYTKLQLAIQNDVSLIEIRDDLGASLERISLPDDRISWIHPTRQEDMSRDQMGTWIQETVPDGSTLQLQVVLSGTDPMFATLPKTFGGIGLEDEYGFIISEETFTTFTMTQAEDKLTIVHNIEVPQVTV
ncbi:hypothetical protein [Oceanobacillus massiliensis]|uniref:hypothetical protein n=1 Tax=Oceanobacillus massiliensis TaxID=1465765 RepID=UPI000289416A|nr:hypothetical protein [Oceanobacillus massiliensis]